jgi:G patch domain-containing protein 1
MPTDDFWKLFPNRIVYRSLVNALASLVPPSKDSIGAQILKKMGWKVGQGIGPKLTYHQRKLQDAQERSRSGYLASTSVEDDEDDEEANKHMYPPRDTKQVIYTRKDNSFGIGYTAGARLDSFDTNQKEMTGPKISSMCLELFHPKVLTSHIAGFGLGALNDAEEDDIDVYDTSNFSSNTHRRNLAFEEQENDDDSTMSLHKSQLHGTTSAFKQPRQAEPLPKSSILFRSGAPVLPGFVLATSQPSEQQW